ncbi:hypothetical protein CPC08DRAFT_770572 [Agrocybe pediades]|nr:hypothetical protein CPC08DRAFT_770572 [Agrocybe pediades]
MRVELRAHLLSSLLPTSSVSSLLSALSYPSGLSVVTLLFFPATLAVEQTVPFPLEPIITMRELVTWFGWLCESIRSVVMHNLHAMLL